MGCKCQHHSSEEFELIPEFETAPSGKGDIRELQRILNKFIGYKIDQDGNWGENTKKALNVFQKKYRLPLTNKPDQKTLELLKKIELPVNTNTKLLFEVGYFDFNVSKASNPIIFHCYMIADLLNKIISNPGISGLQVIGFTDASGSEKSNLKLGFMRALEVEKVLRCAFNHFKTDTGKPHNLPIEIYSGGESFASSRKPEFSRHVKIIVHYKNQKYYDNQNLGIWSNMYNRCSTPIF